MIDTSERGWGQRGKGSDRPHLCIYVSRGPILHLLHLSDLILHLDVASAPGTSCYRFLPVTQASCISFRRCPGILVQIEADKTARDPSMAIDLNNIFSSEIFRLFSFVLLTSIKLNE